MSESDPSAASLACSQATTRFYLAAAEKKKKKKVFLHSCKIKFGRDLGTVTRGFVAVYSSLSLPSHVTQVVQGPPPPLLPLVGGGMRHCHGLLLPLCSVHLWLPCPHS